MVGISQHLSAVPFCYCASEPEDYNDCEKGISFCIPEYSVSLLTQGKYIHAIKSFSGPLEEIKLCEFGFFFIMLFFNYKVKLLSLLCASIFLCTALGAFCGDVFCDCVSCTFFCTQLCDLTLTPSIQMKQ